MKGQKNLNDKQKAALAHVAAADDAYKQAKKYEMAEAKRIAAEKIQAFRLKLDEAVYEAVELGVPKSRVGEEGMGTRNPYTVTDAYNRQADLVQSGPVGFAVKPVEKFSWAQTQYHPATNKAFAFLLVEGDDHYTKTPDEHMNGEGYLFIKPQGRWESLWDTPEHIKKWAAENPPEEVEA